MKFVGVFHGPKAEGMAGRKPTIAANPTMTTDGMEKLELLIPAVKALGPFAALYCSRLARSADGTSLLSLAFDMDFQSVKGLGQHGSKDGDGASTRYPGFEHETYASWQDSVIAAVQQIAKRHGASDNILFVGHRPVIAGLVAASRSIFKDEAELKKITDDPNLTKQGFVVFDFDPGQPYTIKLLE